MTDGIVVTLPNNDKITSTHIASLELPHVSASARVCHIFPTLKNRVLLSIGQFFDAVMTAIFTTTPLYIYDAATVHLQGERNLSTGLWYIDLAYQAPVPLEPLMHSALFPGQPQANNIYELTKKLDIATYLHCACFSPVPNTWTAAIDAGFVSTWPGLTSQLVRQHLPKSVATAKGHLRTACSDQRSTTKPTPIPTIVPPSTPPVATTTPLSLGIIRGN